MHATIFQKINKFIQFKYVEKLGIIYFNIPEGGRRFLVNNDILCLNGVEIETVVIKNWSLNINGGIEIRTNPSYGISFLNGKLYGNVNNNTPGLITPEYIIDLRNVLVREKDTLSYFMPDGNPVPTIPYDLAISHLFAEPPPLLSLTRPIGPALLHIEKVNVDNCTVVGNYTILHWHFYIEGRFFPRIDKEKMYNFYNLDTKEKFVYFNKHEKYYFASATKCIELGKLNDNKADAKLFDVPGMYYKLGETYISREEHDYKIVYLRSPNSGKHTKPALF